MDHNPEEWVVMYHGTS